MKKSLKDRVKELPTLDEVIEKDLANPKFAEEYQEANLRIAIARATKTAREGAGLTQEQLADGVGVHQAQIGRLESFKNKSLPGIDLLAKISAVTKKTVEVVIPGIHLKIAAKGLESLLKSPPKSKVGSGMVILAKKGTSSRKRGTTSRNGRSTPHDSKPGSR